MKSGPNAIYELTGEQFAKIIQRKSGEGDEVVDEIIADATKMSAMQGSNYGHNGKTRPYSIPSAYYHSKAHMEGLMANPNYYKNNYSFPYANELVLPKFIISGRVDISNYDNSFILNSDLFISRCTFKDFVRISNIKSAYSLNYTECVFEKGIYLENCNFKGIHIMGVGDENKDAVFSIIKCELSELNISIKHSKNIFISECKISNLIASGLQSDNFSINKSKIDTCSAKYSRIDNFIVDSSVTNLNIGGEDPESSKSILGDLSINYSDTDQKNVLVITDITLSKLNIGGYFNSDKSLIKHVLLQNSITLSNLNCVGKLKFHNIKVAGSVLHIVNSDLGKSEFINFPFGDCVSVKIVDSKLSDINLSKCTAPINVIGENENDHAGAREGIKQFRQTFSKSGDKIQEMYLIPKEYDEHYESLNWNGSLEGMFDKIVLSFNKVSNTHGQGVGRAFFITIAFSIFSYTIYCLFLGIRPGCDAKQTVKIISFFLEYVNPLHKPEYLTDNLLLEKRESVISFARFWEGFSKIIITYLLYQFVQAFRKYGK